MVSPRFPALSRVDRDSADLQRRFKGLVRRGRVAGVNRLYTPAIVDVDVSGYGGQTARIRNLPILARDYDLSAVSTPRIGADVLVLVPTGDISDGGYVLGVVAKPAILADNLGNEARGSVRVGPTATETIAGDIRQDADERTLRVVGLAVATAGGVNAAPRAKVTLSDGGGSVVADADFRAREVYGDAGTVSVVAGTGDTLPNIVLEGELEAKLTGGELYRLSVELYASAINTLPPSLGGRASVWSVYVTEGDNQFPPASEALLVFDPPSGPVSLVRVYGQFV